MTQNDICGHSIVDCRNLYPADPNAIKAAGPPSRSPNWGQATFDSCGPYGNGEYGTEMTDWLHNLSVPWMALAVFGTTYFLAAAIFAVVNLIAKAERARAFKAISPGLLPPLGILFGLFVAFTAAQVWSDIDRAIAMVHIDNRRGSAIAMGIFATGIAVSVLLIAAHDRPFTGQISVGPDPLLQLLPKGNTG